MKILAKVSLGIVLLFSMFMSIVGVRADQYGADTVTDLFSGLWNAWWPLVALLFIIGMILTYFRGPSWLAKIFGVFRR